VIQICTVLSIQSIMASVVVKEELHFNSVVLSEQYPCVLKLSMMVVSVRKQRCLRSKNNSLKKTCPHLNQPLMYWTKDTAQLWLQNNMVSSVFSQTLLRVTASLEEGRLCIQHVLLLFDLAMSVL